MPATDQDVRALEHLARRLREDTYGCKPWDAEGTHVVFARELLGKNLAYAIELVLHHACDPNAKTPAAITRKFTPDLPAPPTPGPPKATESCPRHPGSPAANCGGCNADRLAGDASPAPSRGRPRINPDVIAAARAAAFPRPEGDPA